MFALSLLRLCTAAADENKHMHSYTKCNSRHFLEKSYIMLIKTTFASVMKLCNFSKCAPTAPPASCKISEEWDVFFI